MQKKISLLFLFFSFSFYGQNDTISVIKHTDKDIVVNKESKIVYRGIPNSLSIEVPNCKSFIASADGLTMISKNLYNLNPGAGSEVIITVDIVLKNNKKKVEKHVFGISNIGRVIATLNFIDGNNLKLQKSSLKGATLRINFEDKNLKQNFISISSFKIKMPNRKEIQINGNSIDEISFNEINKNTSKNDIITFYQIKTIIHCGISAIHLDSILVKIL